MYQAGSGSRRMIEVSFSRRAARVCRAMAECDKPSEFPVALAMLEKPLSSSSAVPQCQLPMTDEPNEQRRANSNLLRFLVMFSALYMAFGVASPFFPAFLSSRGVT